MYQNTFALDKVSFKERKNNTEASPEYSLNNYNYYNPNLEKDFYLRVFLKKSLFDIDILELEDFLSFQYENSENKEKFIKTLKLKVIPSIEKIICNANFSLEGGSYHDQIKLEDGFVKSDGLVKHREFEYHMFYHWAAFDKLTEDLKERKTIFLEYIENSKGNNNLDTLNWRGKPSHLAFLIGQLIEEGYLEAPVKTDNEINYSEISRTILKLFSFQKTPSQETLRRYLNNNDDKHQALKETFDNAGYHLPNSGILG